MLIIQRSQLKAASHSMAKGDTRYYLNGLLIQSNNTGQVAIVSTDGHRLFAGLIVKEGFDGPSDLSVIIPADVVKKECKGKGGIILRQNADQWQLGDTVFTPIDGTFPNWQRVTAEVYNNDDTSSGQFNCTYLADAQKALGDWCGISYVAVQHHGQHTALLATESAYVLVMPMRVSESDTRPFAWNVQQVVAVAA